MISTRHVDQHLPGAPARANREGHPCPPWCVTDHETDHGSGHRFIFHGTETTRVDVPGKVKGIPDVIFTRAIHPGWPDCEPQVAVSATRQGTDGPGPNAWISPRDAEDLAAIVEMLAKASPAQHRLLAAAIRQAAATITEAGQ
jgi:hypothetical protein